MDGNRWQHTGSTGPAPPPIMRPMIVALDARAARLGAPDHDRRHLRHLRCRQGAPGSRFGEAQAEAAVAMVRDAVTEGGATKADLKAAVASLKAEIAPLRWGIGFLSALTLATAARLFGAF